MIEHIVEVRDASAADQAGMATVYRRASLSNEGDRPHLLANPAYLELSAAAVQPGRSVVAVVEGRVVVFASVDPVDDGLELEALFVDPDWMRRHIGTALVAELVERARRRRLSTIAVSANVHALEFYRQAGFVEIGTVQVEFGPAPRMVLLVASADDDGG